LCQQDVIIGKKKTKDNNKMKDNEYWD